MKAFQKIPLIFLCFFLFYAGADAQSARKYYPKYNLDKPWIDSLKSIIRKGEPSYPYGVHMTTYWKKEFRFLKSCETLGLYYERLYDKGNLKNMSKSLFYYEKIANLSKFPDYDTIVYKASALRTTICRKLEDIYFKGKGVRKNREKSFYYALYGMTDQGMFKFYSERYFHCNCMLLNATSKFDYDRDLTFTFKANPFASFTGIFRTAPVQAELRKIADVFLKKYAAQDLIMLINANAVASASGQAQAYQLVENIKRSILRHTPVSEQKIFTNVNVGDGPSLEITFMTLKEFESTL